MRKLQTLVTLMILVGILGWSASVATGAPGGLVDSDGDGIPDIYETNGIRDASGNMLVDLKAMGADPHHKDLFVQCDYMTAHSHTHKPKADALQKVIEAFAEAPVNNPDGHPGIHIHIDAGPESIMNPVTGAKWGELSHAAEVHHADNLGTEDANENYDWGPLDEIKKANFPAARAPVFRYCLWAHGYANCGSSGIARGLPGDDLLVTLGTFDGEEGTVLDQAGTFMHEFGHTLGLHHGGSDDLNYKPNFFSIMSYNYQFQGLRIQGLDGTLDYSRAAVPTLDEHALPEAVPGAPAGYGIRWRLVHGGEAVDLVAEQAGHVDWTQQGGGGASLSLDVNGDGEITKLEGPPDEWASLSYKGLEVGDFTEATTHRPNPNAGHSRPRFTPNKETATKKEADLIPTDYAVSTVLSDDQEGPAGTTVTLHLTVHNEGKKDDTYTLQREHESDWADLKGLPARVSLAAGKSQKFDIPVHIPAGTPKGHKETVGVEATSQANKKILDSAESIVTSLGGTASRARGLSLR